MTHKCSPCGQEFDTEEQYLNHECEKAGGAKPTSPEFLIKTTTPHYDKIAEASLKRGAEKAQ